ncbi:hypothetical protein [Oribacterium sp. C9]|uniref:hypothetical protein n=1 Tax=Oribacterium sp. C9 TaxID=1943579 RepID=UPI001115677C|nr:hypothetical protein [Oribacterium sp. C9]
MKRSVKRARGILLTMMLVVVMGAEALAGVKNPWVKSNMNATGSVGDPQIEEQVIYSENGVEITAVSILVEDGTGNVALWLKLKNETDDKLQIIGKTMYINDIYVDSSIYIGAEAGETEYHVSLVTGEELEKKKIDKIEKMDFDLEGLNSKYKTVFETDLLHLDVGTVSKSAKSENKKESKSGKSEKSDAKSGKKDKTDKTGKSGSKTSKGSKAKDDHSEVDGEEKFWFYGYNIGGKYYPEDENKDMLKWYVTLKDDGNGYLYWGDDNKGDIEYWKGSGDDFSMQAGISDFTDGCSLKDGILKLDIDGIVIVFITDDVNKKKLK